ncbi:dihydropyrimidine dehydrogenase [Histomonas meleagridis]|uniref:dihydropyrimidine dehydrogenase n=1 Tax=Histomonas meleagridis TaxID=135588 RepID=UPI00355A2708|nr:dihydropyrimidine dehydrogenase [Histomonas meleagridis]KAH0799168.1 dihydropyrimidine dehydrogenase [Histomonas meleagridis]
MLQNVFPSRINPKKDYKGLSQYQFDGQIDRCIQCFQKPCSKSCPCHCSPRDFIHVASGGNQSDFDLASILLYSMNPLSATCGQICPTKFCMQNCSRGRFDMAINIPGVQAEIVRRAFENGKSKFLSYLPKPNQPTGKKVAVVGAGPAGLSCAAFLGMKGHSVTIFEKEAYAGGDLIYIPKSRFSKGQIDKDVKFVLSCGDIEIKYNTEFKSEMESNFDATCYCVGMAVENELSIPGKEHSTIARKFLLKSAEEIKDKSVVIIGCGAVAIDCAIHALKSGASYAQILYRRRVDEAPLSTDERGLVEAFGVSIVQRTILQSIEEKNGKLLLNTIRVDGKLNPIPESEQKWNEIDYCVSAVGFTSTLDENAKFSAGQSRGKAMSAVQACASGKNVAHQIDCYLKGEPIPEIPDFLNSTLQIFTPNMRPADISIEFLNKKLSTPLIAAASPLTDNLNAARNLLKSGWGGLVMKVVSDPKYCVSFHKKSDDYIFNGEQTAEKVFQMTEHLREEYPESLLIAELDATSSSFENDLKSLETSKLDAIQILNSEKNDRQYKLPILYITKVNENQNEFAVVELRRNLSSNVYSDEKSKIPIKKELYPKGFAVCGGIQNYKMALYYLSNNALFVEVDPSRLERGGKEIDFMNAQLSYYIANDGCKSLKEYIEKSNGQTSVDIEDIEIEQLACNLTNPYVCIGCGRCTICPNDAIDLEPAKWKYVVDLDKCVGCGMCVSRCPTGAISLVPRKEASKQGH